MFHIVAAMSDKDRPWIFEERVTGMLTDTLISLRRCITESCSLTVQRVKNCSVPVLRMDFLNSVNSQEYVISPFEESKKVTWAWVSGVSMCNLFTVRMAESSSICDTAASHTYTSFTV